MEIVKFKKLKDSKYKITLDIGIDYIIYDDVIIKYNLLYKKKISPEILKVIVEENEIYETYSKVIKFIDKKLRSKKQIIDYLTIVEKKEHLIPFVIERLEKINLINDKAFAYAYCHDKVNLTKEGPRLIQKGLLKAGIEGDLIDLVISDINIDYMLSKAFKIADKIRLSDNKHGKMYITNSIREKLYLLGYDEDVINDVISSLNIVTNSQIVTKEYEKLYKKFSYKYDDYHLATIIYSKLKAKGFTTEEIKDVMNK